MSIINFLTRQDQHVEQIITNIECGWFRGHKIKMDLILDMMLGQA